MDIQAVVQGGPQQQGETQTQTPATTAAAATAAPAADPTAIPSSQGPNAQDDRHQPLTSAVARLFGSPSSEASHTVQVSYRVAKEPNEIVTVFTDPKTGEEIAQFPSEIMVQIAQFFDKESGVTLDQSA